MHPSSGHPELTKTFPLSSWSLFRIMPDRPSCDDWLHDQSSEWIHENMSGQHVSLCRCDVVIELHDRIHPLSSFVTSSELCMGQHTSVMKVCYCHSFNECAQSIKHINFTRLQDPNEPWSYMGGMRDLRSTTGGSPFTRNWSARSLGICGWYFSRRFLWRWKLRKLNISGNQEFRAWPQSHWVCSDLTYL